MKRCWLLCPCVLQLFTASQSHAAEEPKPAEYGTLKGRFVWQGDVPERREVVVLGGDKEALERGGHLPMLDDALLVDGKSKGVANVCVWLYVRRGEAAPKSHPSYDAPRMEGEPQRDRVKMLGTRYVPRIAVARSKHLIQFSGEDQIPYNPKFTAASQVDPLRGVLPVGATIQFELAKAEMMPIKISDAIHPWMTGWLIVQDHPYVAVSDATGRFEIANIPSGAREFAVWHERFGWVKTAKLDGKQTDWPRGRFKVELTPAGIDLGDIVLSPGAENP